MRKYKNLEKVFNKFMEDLKYNPKKITNKKEYKYEYQIYDLHFIMDMQNNLSGIILELATESCLIKVDTFYEKCVIEHIDHLTGKRISQKFDISDYETWTKIIELVKN